MSGLDRKSGGGAIAIRMAKLLPLRHCRCGWLACNEIVGNQILDLEAPSMKMIMRLG